VSSLSFRFSNQTIARFYPSPIRATCPAHLIPRDLITLMIFGEYILRIWSRDSSVGIATGWTAGVRFPSGQEIFLYSTASRPTLGPTQPIKWIKRVLSPGVKRPGYEADHSPRISAEDKNTWIYASTPLYAFMA
jgi:hypothetical protein